MSEKKKPTDALQEQLDKYLPELQKIYGSLKTNLLNPVGNLLNRSSNNLSDTIQLGVDLINKELRGKHTKNYWRYSYEELNKILKDEMCPCAFLDLESFDENVDWLDEEIQKYGKKVRIGTKSIRVPELTNRALKKPNIEGLFIFHPNEIQYYQEKYKQKDFLLAYPIYNRPEADVLSSAIKRDSETRVHVMVDSPAHLYLLEKSAAKHHVKLGIIVDYDASVNFMGQLAGVMRSPLRLPKEVVSLALQCNEFTHLEFRGIMGYEGQEAGIGDFSVIYSLMKQKSRRENVARRSAIVKALKEAGLEPEIVNGGGSGCFQDTADEDPVTEVTIGSGLFKSYIFDPIESMDNFKPSLFMALRIVRFPKNGVATCFSGGYVSSAINKSPKVVLPEGCKETPREGFGEVQTPILYNPNEVFFNLGDIIICRLAKAGEPMERFNEVAIISKGKIVDHYPTNRGCGLWCG
ncbi:MAG: alanine racemase [Candidatus Lokiarchaeota archaeon]|nr:alanine racemase [Candidatus Lokiarchaeota archaeon]